jgi:hypothetical protein
MQTDYAAYIMKKEILHKAVSEKSSYSPEIFYVFYTLHKIKVVDVKKRRL